MTTRTTLGNEVVRLNIIQRIEKLQNLLSVKQDRLIRYPILGQICMASNSGKPVFDCWCAECKEITTTIIKHDREPEWLK